MAHSAAGEDQLVLNYEDAIAAAEQELGNAIDLPEGDSLVLLLEHTIERPFGWVFFYTSRLYRETGELKYALAGNAPVIVDRSSGAVVATGTALPVEHYIAEYEARAGHTLVANQVAHTADVTASAGEHSIHGAT
jgi:hypothetical protein